MAREKREMNVMEDEVRNAGVADVVGIVRAADVMENAGAASVVGNAGAASEVDDLEAELRELENLQASLKNKKSGGRKLEVLAILSDGKEHTISNIATTLKISPTNVSSQLHYLREDGWAICNGNMSTSHKKCLLDKNGKPRNLANERAEIMRRKAALGK